MAEGQRKRARRRGACIPALTLQIVGSSPAMPRPGGASSAYLVRSDAAAILLDAGTGSFAKLALAIDYRRLAAIVISHMHSDHFFDLVPFRYTLKYGHLANERRLPLWLPPGGRERLQALRAAVSIDAAEDFFEIVFDVREYDPSEPLILDDVTLRFRKTRHYVAAYAVRAECNGASLTYSADTAPCDAVVELARGASLFLCEAGLGLEREEAERRGHCNAEEAGEMAQRAGTSQLLLTHYPAAFEPDALITAARRRFSGAVLAAHDGLTLAV
jgi:ribonuclease BN (tRNA processing enzyme)